MYDDVRTITAARLAADGIAVDAVVGSPPCQDASTANTRGRGIDGERTGLYLEAIRIVLEVRPRWFAFENVPGIRNRGIDRVLGKLEDGGYACWPLVVGAADLGAPHLRKRSWVVGADAETVQQLALAWDQPDGNPERAAANAAQAALPQYRSLEQEGGGCRTERRRLTGDNPDAGVAIGAGLEVERRKLGHDGPQRQALERAIASRCGPVAETWNGGIAGRLRMDDGLPKGMARPMLAAYGDAIVPQISELIGRAFIRAFLETEGIAE
jgi:DNA (cytosine-5)-methyltransferase 1